jgi:hypothetical protein
MNNFSISIIIAFNCFGCYYRAEFEASVDIHSEEETPSIMDEDEWTDRNFGNSLLMEEEENENTSEDSLSDLESDADNTEEEG